MSQKLREELLPRLRSSYVRRDREGRSRMISDLCEQFGYSRKHATKMLGAPAGWGGDPAVRKGRPTVPSKAAFVLLVAEKRPEYEWKVRNQIRRARAFGSGRGN